jgi:hypothetical protein
MTTSDLNEINLMDVLARFYATLKRNLILTLLLPILGLLTGIAISYNSRDLFESSLLIETSLLTQSECKFLFEQLNKVGIIPGLTPEDDAKVQGFNYEVTKDEEVQRTNNSEVSLNEKTIYLQITARVHDESVFPALQKAVVTFVNESPAVTRHRHDRQKFYDGMIGRINTELVGMEEIKKEINTRTQATYLNPSDLYAQSVALYKEKTKYEIEREAITSVHLLKGFDSLTVDAKMNTTLFAIIGFIVGLLILLLVLFIQYFSLYYRDHQKNV